MTRPSRDALRKHFMEREHETLKRHPNAEILLGAVQDAATLEQEIETALNVLKSGDKVEKRLE